MYKPLRNRVHKYFFKCYHSIMLGNIKTFTNQISFLKILLLTRNILDEKNYKMNALFKIIHTFILRFQYGPMLLMPKVFSNILMESFNMTPNHPLSLKVA